MIESTLKDRLTLIHYRMRMATELAGRASHDVQLMLATKTQSADTLKGCIGLGETLFGENRVQEFVPKYDALRDYEITWQFIGHLQSNKVRDVVGRVKCIQSIDRVSLAQAVHDECVKRETSIEVLIEVNTSGETTKHGVQPTEVQRVIDAVSALPTMRIGGFMTIGALSEDERVVRACFERLRNIRDAYDGTRGATSQLSMGMSDDLEWAIAEGSTMIRVGSSVFGER